MNARCWFRFTGDNKKEDFITTDRSPEGESHPEDHGTSAAAVDWDDDGDLDLLLGSYEGNLYLRRNEGSAKQPRFALTNERIRLGTTFLQVPDGMTTPRIADWNGDGLFDLICGGIEGGVYYFENVGSKSTALFEKRNDIDSAVGRDQRQLPASYCTKRSRASSRASDRDACRSR